MLGLLLKNWVRRRVRAGARELDRLRPGWEKQVNPQRLHIACGSACVLGQLYGSYNTGMAILHDNGAKESAYDYGFCARLNEWDELDAEWKKFLGERERERVNG